MILVDPLRWYADRRGRRRWAHMVTTETEDDELHVAAELIGLRRGWFQSRARHPHYDLRPRQWRRVLGDGALLVATRDLVRRRPIPICAGYGFYACTRGSSESYGFDPDVPPLFVCSQRCAHRVLAKIYKR